VTRSKLVSVTANRYADGIASVRRDKLVIGRGGDEHLLAAGLRKRSFVGPALHSKLDRAPGAHRRLP